MTDWTVDVWGMLMHCGQFAYWEDCEEHDECYRAVCSKCQEETMTDCQEILTLLPEGATLGVYPKESSD